MAFRVLKTSLANQINLRRTDLIEDTGTSISPEIDVGQVEGGYVMSLGLWTTEEIKYDPDTGRLLTNGTWVSEVSFLHFRPQFCGAKWHFGFRPLRITKFRRATTSRPILGPRFTTVATTLAASSARRCEKI